MFKKLFRKSTGSSGSPAKDDADSPGTSPAGKEPAGKELMAGIGIVFQLAPDGGLYIKSMSPDGAAHESGILQQGDCLMSVDGVNVFGKSAEFVTSKIMGKVGSPVATKFRRNVIMEDGACQFRFVAPVLTRGKAAELPQPAGVGIIFKVGHDKGMYVKSMSPDGPAKLSEQVHLEDCLMTVDGRSVHQRPVTDVTPLLTGAFGSEVKLGLKRMDGKMVEVTLTRGKRATFRDEASPLQQQGITTKAISVMVPKGGKPGDLIAAQDDQGNSVRVRIPQGAAKGTLLRVPVGLNVDASKSDPKNLERILREVVEVPGRPNVYSWDGRNIYGPKSNADGTLTIKDADNGFIVWHGKPLGEGGADEGQKDGAHRRNGAAGDARTRTSDASRSVALPGGFTDEDAEVRAWRRALMVPEDDAWNWIDEVDEADDLTDLTPAKTGADDLNMQPVWASPPPTPSAQSQTSSTASGQSLMPYTRESSALSAGSAGSGSSLSALASPAGGGVAGLSGRAIGELSGSAVAGLGESLLGGHRQLMMGVMSLGLGGPASGHVAERGAGLGEGPGGGARAGAGVRALQLQQERAAAEEMADILGLQDEEEDPYDDALALVPAPEDAPAASTSDATALAMTAHAKDMREGMSRVTINRVGVAAGLQVLGGSLISDTMGGDAKVVYENLRDVRSVVDQFEKLIAM